MYTASAYPEVMNIMVKKLTLQASIRLPFGAIERSMGAPLLEKEAVCAFVLVAMIETSH